MSRSKFDNLVLYVCKKSESDLKLGRTKLNKLLYYIDFGYYRKTGESVSGEPYMAIDNGPVPRHMKPALGRLKSSGALAEEEIHIGLPRPRMKPTALVEPEWDAFDQEEISFIDDIISRYEGLNGTDLSKMSHSEPGYLAVSWGEDIPYGTAYCPTFVKVTESEKARTEELAEAYGWHTRYAA